MTAIAYTHGGNKHSLLHNDSIRQDFRIYGNPYAEPGFLPPGVDDSITASAMLPPVISNDSGY